jgi:hypothetical protein
MEEEELLEKLHKILDSLPDRIILSDKDDRQGEADPNI